VRKHGNGMWQKEVVGLFETLKVAKAGFEDGHSIIRSKGTNVMLGRDRESSYRPKSEVDCLRSIDASLITIRRIAIGWLVLSILAMLFMLLRAIAGDNDAFY
jgi:hypothetical protein